VDYRDVYFNSINMHRADIADVFCEICGRPIADVHHINGRLGDLRTDPYNLVGVCRSCHKQCHHIGGSIDKEILTEIVLNRLER